MHPLIALALGFCPTLDSLVFHWPMSFFNIQFFKVAPALDFIELVDCPLSLLNFSELLNFQLALP